MPAGAAGQGRGIGRRKSRWWLLLALGLLGTAALAFRLDVVRSYRASAGDGLQYFKLSYELKRNHRFAYGPPPSPLTYTRLPGYPLFLAAIAEPALPRSLEQHLYWATLWNAVLDVLTGLLVFAILRERRLGYLAATLGFLSVIVCPLLVYLSTYGLCESLATFLTTLQLWLLLRYVDRRELRWAALAGAAAGLGQLVRVDAVAALPAAALLLVVVGPSLRRRVQAVAAFALAGLLVFAPWPARNLLRFGAPHVAGTPWVAQDGSPLPTGMAYWFLSWASGAPGQAYVLLPLAYGAPLDPHRPGLLQPAMYDDEPERQRVISLYERYNQQGLSPAVDAGFRQLAAERARRHPLRTFVTLPLRRVSALWSPMPEYELPVRSRLLHLPQLRQRYARFETGLLALGLLGALVLLFGRPSRWPLVTAVALLLAARTVLMSAVHPFPVQRYLVEAFPVVLALGGCGLAWLAGLPLRLRARRPSP